jgi:hypothetical protein
MRLDYVSFTTKSNPIATFKGRMTLRYVKVESNREPFNIGDWARDAWCALRHQFPAQGTLRRDGDTVFVISRL